MCMEKKMEKNEDFAAQYRHKIKEISDASDKAAVAFIRTIVADSVSTSFVFAKYRVAPIAQQTIPKLELQGAVLAVRVAKTICAELEYSIREVHYWSDSLVVLKQIRSESRRFPMFVACRLGEIYENSIPSQWHWVPYNQNIADLATKVHKNVILQSGCEWFSGPKFLSLSEDSWPKETTSGVEESCLFHIDHTKPRTVEVVPDEHRFSSWLRLHRATAWILHFVKQLKDVNIRNNSPDVRTLEEAHKLLILKCQMDTFQEDLFILQKKKELLKNSRIYKLSPFIDKDGILRIKGRFPENNSLNLEFDVCCPIILDPKHRTTELIIFYYHKKTGHVGIEAVINSLRTKYWILHMRAAVKKCFKNCQFCKVRKCNPVAPEMGLLPVERLKPFVYPFSYVGIDFFGPMTVSVGRRVEKRYGVLFTCLTVRAIHIEIAATLDTSSTILAIRRFMSRRGQPIEIITDNGTNFVGAERELREWMNDIDNSQIQEELATKGIIWKFNPPAAASMGGIWERMVRTVKSVLKVVLKSVNPKEEVLQTLLAEAEYIINNRPLTHVSIDYNEPEALTPNHFLIHRAGDVKSYGELKGDLTSRKQWRLAQALANNYWKRWVVEYRQTLVNRQKWYSTTKPIKINDVVIILDEKAPRNEWLMGKVDEVFPGPDGVIRVATVKTRKGTYKRPVSKLCILPTDDEVQAGSKGGEC